MRTLGVDPWAEVERTFASILDWLGSWSWAQFFPDVVAAIVTGLIVGAALLIAESIRRTQDYRNAARDGATRLVHPLLLELQRSGDDPRLRQLRKLGRRRAKALAIVEGSSIELWHEMRPTKLTSAILSFRTASWSLLAQAKELDSAVARWCRIHEPHEELRQFAVQRLKGATDQVLLAQYAPAWAQLNLEYRELAASSVVKKAASGFRGKSNRAIQRENELRSTLVEVMTKRRAARAWNKKPRTLC